jgi:hypothetical protein
MRSGAAIACGNADSCGRSILTICRPQKRETRRKGGFCVGTLRPIGSGSLLLCREHPGAVERCGL